MRRFASVFNPKREKRESNKPRPAALAISRSTPPPLTTPQLTANSSDHAQSSSSSAGSASIRTPEDEHPPSHPGKKSWKSWFGSIKSKSGTQKRPQPRMPQSASQPLQKTQWEPPAERRTRLPPRLSVPPGMERLVTAVGSRTEETDQDTETDSEDPYNDNESALVSTPQSFAISPLVAEPTFPAARATLRRMTEHGLVNPAEASPFVSVPGVPGFPRSSNPLMLQMRPSLRTATLKSRLLNCLDAMPDDVSILPLALRAAATPASPPEFQIDAHAVPRGVQVLEASLGIRRWISRPCFEDRYAVWLAEDGIVVRKPVSGTLFAVLELECSEALEALAGFGVDLPLSIPLTVTPPSEPGHSMNTVYSMSSSPLQIDSSPSRSLPAIPASESVETPTLLVTVPKEIPPQATPLISTASPGVDPVSLTLLDSFSTTPTSGTALAAPLPDTVAIAEPIPEATIPVKRGVRFAEATSDGIPVDYALRALKRREEKAKFLREEQARRAMEAERRRLEEARIQLERERLAQTKERAEFERQRKAWERERGQREAEQREKLERKEKILRDEVVNSRARREAARAGGVPGAASTNTPFGVYGGSQSRRGSFYGSGSGQGASSSSSSLREGVNSHERNSIRGEKRHSQYGYESPTSQSRSLLPPHPPLPPSTQNLSPRIVPRLQPSESDHIGRTGSSNSLSSPSPMSTSTPVSSRPSSMSGHGVIGQMNDSSRSMIEQVPEDVTASFSNSARKRLSLNSVSSRPVPSRSTTMPSFAVPAMYTTIGPVGIVPAMAWSGTHQMQLGAMGANTMMFPGMQMAPYIMDMGQPLLPPNPPFMVQQYPRARASSRSSSSRDHSLERPGGNRGREDSMSGQSVDYHRERTSSTGSRRQSSGVPNTHESSNPPSPQIRSHSRRGSSDMSPSSFSYGKRSSSGQSISSKVSRHVTGQKGASSSSSLPPLPPHAHSLSHGLGQERGRSPRPDTYSVSKSSRTLPYSQSQSPWTALPSKGGGLSNSVYASHSHQQPMKPTSSRRQTTYS